MASAGEKVVRPSVLDRLAGRVPKNVPGPQLRSGLRELRAAVARDLETLLNTTVWLPWDLQASRELSSSPLAYGIPDVSAHSWLSQRDGQTMCAAIEQAIRAHEPRLEPRTVRVELKDRDDLADFRVRFRIEALLRVDPIVEQVSFDSEVDYDNGGIRIGGAG
jgi:type VI secretion system protein ImpF